MIRVTAPGRAGLLEILRMDMVVRWLLFNQE